MQSVRDAADPGAMPTRRQRQRIKGRPQSVRLQPQLEATEALRRLAKVDLAEKQRRVQEPYLMAEATLARASTKPVATGVHPATALSRLQAPTLMQTTLFPAPRRVSLGSRSELWAATETVRALEAMRLRP